MKLTRYLAMLDILKVTTILVSAVFITSASANAAEIVIKNQDGLISNQIEFKRVKYTGQCPGVFVSQIG